MLGGKSPSPVDSVQQLRQGRRGLSVSRAPEWTSRGWLEGSPREDMASFVKLVRKPDACSSALDRPHIFLSCTLAHTHSPHMLTHSPTHTFSHTLTCSVTLHTHMLTHPHIHTQSHTLSLTSPSPNTLHTYTTHTSCTFMLHTHPHTLLHTDSHSHPSIPTLTPHTCFPSLTHTTLAHPTHTHSCPHPLTPLPRSSHGLAVAWTDWGLTRPWAPF